MSEYADRCWKSECVVCGEKVKHYNPEFCCSGQDCTCMGLPIEPPLCDKRECNEKIYGGK